MALLGWKDFTNLENSLADFLSSAITTSSLQVLNDQGSPVDVNVRVGWEPNDNWALPLITLYEDSRLSPRGFIGSNKRLKEYLLILDIRGWNDKQRSELADWLESTINDGFPFYEYTVSGDPDNPTKAQAGYAAVQFLTNAPIRGGINADLLEKYRQRISVAIQLEGDS